MPQREFTEEEREKLVELGEAIIDGLSCNIKNTGLPCRSDRIYTVCRMREWVAINEGIGEGHLIALEEEQ